MLIRRIRGVLVSALLCGAAGALFGTALFAMMNLTTSHHGDFRGLRSDLVDFIPGLFAYAATLGGLVALGVTIAARKGISDESASRRFMVWGTAAGLLAGLGLATFPDFDWRPLSKIPLKSLVSTIIWAAFAGGQGAWMILQIARRSPERLQAARSAIARIGLLVFLLAPMASAIVLGDCLYNYRHGQPIGWVEPLIGVVTIAPLFYFAGWRIRRARQRRMAAV